MVVVELLRRHILQSDSLRVSNEARAEKTSQLYDFVTSERFAQLLEELETLSDDLLELEVKEHKAHEQVWSRRGQVIRSIQKAHGTLAAEIEQITGILPADAPQ